MAHPAMATSPRLNPKRMDNYEEENRQLLQRFANALHSKSDEHFDEDELLDIFDFAGDYGMDYLRAEALFWGMRKYPDSKPLLERRAVFYADVLGFDAVNRFNDDQNDADSLLINILSARANIGDKQSAINFIKDVFDKYRNIEDEEAIQLVNLAADTNNLDWLSENMEQIKHSLAYMPAFLYEFGAVAMQRNDYDIAIKALDMLVSEMPYNAEYWSMISLCQLRLENIAEATESAEMALAIEPENAGARLAKARCLERVDENAFLKYVQENCDNRQLIELLTEHYRYDLLKTEKVDSLVRALIAPHIYEWIDSVGVQSAFLILFDENMNDHLDLIWKNDPESTDGLVPKISVWTQWAHSLYIAGYDRAALYVVEAVYRNVPGNASGICASDIIPLISLAASLHFKAENYRAVIEDINLIKGTHHSLAPVLRVLHVTALIKLHCFEEARMMVIDTLHQSHLSTNELEHFTQQGVFCPINYKVDFKWMRRLFIRLQEEMAPERIGTFDAESFSPFDANDKYDE